MIATYQLSVAQYDRMIESGVFEPASENQVELVNGVLRKMSPIGPRHEQLTDLLADWSIRNTNADEVRIRIQNSIGIPELDSVPEPDIAWVKPKDYRDDRPRAKDVLLLIEVSDSSLTYDLGEKAEMYAAARIADYWVVNIPHWQIEVFRRPRSGKFHDHSIAKMRDKVSPLAFPKLKLSVEHLFKGE